MAAGRYRGCREHDYVTRVINVEISTKKGRYRRHSKFQQDWSHDKELANGFNRVVEESVEREPGELSSEDEGIPNPQNGFLVSGQRKFSPIVLENQQLIDERQNCQNGRLINGQKKFYPIVWESSKDGKKQSVDVKNLIEVEGYGEEPVPSRNTSFSLRVNENAVRDVEEALSERREISCPLDGPQILMEEDVEFAPTRSILSSRWANGNDDEEAEAVVEEVAPKRRKTSPLDANPEPALRGGSDRSSSKNSSSSMNGGDSDIDDCNDDGNGSEGLSGTESDEVDCEDKNPERSINMLQGCRSVDEFEKLNRIDEGTYGVVFRARDKKTGEVVALKKVKLEKEREGFPLTSLREINILLSFHHPSIVDVKEVVMGSMDSIFMVMEYMENDLKGLMESMKQPFMQSEVKCLMLQLLSGVNYLHDNWVLHRDLKTSNILLNNHGELKICDFGLSRQYGSPLKPYTQLVVTLWYRAPELLLGAKEYSTAIDMWSLGCIMAELLANEPLFPGKTEVDQLVKIFRILGTPNEKIWPGFARLPGFKVNFVKQPYNMLREKFPRTSFTGSPTVSEAGFDLLSKLLAYDPEKRITTEDALNHAWFREVPLPKSKDFMPTFPAQHAQDRHLRRVRKSPDPLEELRVKELQAGRKELQAGVWTGGLFG